jgi:hypothetical protein
VRAAISDDTWRLPVKAPRSGLDHHDLCPASASRIEHLIAVYKFNFLNTLRRLVSIPGGYSKKTIETRNELVYDPVQPIQWTIPSASCSASLLALCQWRFKQPLLSSRHTRHLARKLFTSRLTVSIGIESHACEIAANRSSSSLNLLPFTSSFVIAQMCSIGVRSGL